MGSSSNVMCSLICIISACRKPSTSLSDSERSSRAKARHRRIDIGQIGRAQEQARRKALVGAPEHAAGVLGLDQALDRDGEVGDRSVGQDMRDIAERILMHVEPRVGGDVDLPFGDILAVMAARRHAQDLNDAGGRRLVAIAGGMGNSQAHDGPELEFGSTHLEAKRPSCPDLFRASTSFFETRTQGVDAGHPA